jgi:7-carboxy-7-deazaguanine synthase
MTIAQVMARIGDLGIPTVELTGGEPLAQEATVPLMRQLISQGYRVMIETSGAEPIESIPQDVHIIMDLKCPGSRMESSNRYENLATLKVTDEVKFVVADRADFEWARSVMADYRLEGRVNVLLSPAFGLVKPADLAQWIIEDRLNARLNLQQHKYIWHPKAKGV